MDLDKVFDLGHTLAISRNPELHVVRRSADPPWPAGYYVVASESVESAALRKRVDASDIVRRLGSDEARAFHWSPDNEWCWCRACQSARRVARTQVDTGRDRPGVRDLE